MNQEKQKTIKQAISLAGIGLHTGSEVTIRFVPAPENHGIKFKRVDLPNQPVIDANIDYVVDTSRGTSIEHNGVRISTVEHCLASIVGLGIDNILVELDHPEMPIMDGSAREFVEALQKCTIVEQNADKEYFELKTNITYTNPEKKVELLAIPSDSFRLSVVIDYETSVLGCQQTSCYSPEQFASEIAPSRTFVFLHELEFLLNNNLIKGGDLNNAIVFVNRVIGKEELQKLSQHFRNKNVEVLKEGILNNVELRHPNEPARHKLLDIYGDLALIGTPLKAHIIANRPGHQSNVQFAKRIKQHITQLKQQTDSIQFDPNAKPIFDINDIRRMLPHRPPFLLVDKIMEMSDKHIVGVKNVTMNEDFFVGHFPNEPVMPAVLQIEAMAQTGGILALSSVPDPENYSTYFMKIDNFKFRQKVIPGDTLVFRLDLITPIRRGLCHMKGVAYVNNKPVMEGEMLAQVIKNK